MPTWLNRYVLFAVKSMPLGQCWTRNMNSFLVPQTMTTAISSAKWGSITWLLHFPEQVSRVRKLPEPLHMWFECFAIFGLGLWLVLEVVLPNHRIPLSRQMIYGLGMLLLVSLREDMVRITFTQTNSNTGSRDAISHSSVRASRVRVKQSWHLLSSIISTPYTMVTAVSTPRLYIAISGANTSKI